MRRLIRYSAEASKVSEHYQIPASAGPGPFLRGVVNGEVDVVSRLFYDRVGDHTSFSGHSY